VDAITEGKCQGLFQKPSQNWSKQFVAVENKEAADDDWPILVRFPL
jgi:hypothetical protein